VKGIGHIDVTAPSRAMPLGKLNPLPRVLPVVQSPAAMISFTAVLLLSATKMSPFTSMAAPPGLLNPDPALADEDGTEAPGVVTAKVACGPAPIPERSGCQQCSNAEELDGAITRP